MCKRPPKLTGDWLTCAPTVALMKMFDEAGHEARFVGGVVRNSLLDEPVGDLDIATDALPETVMSLAQKAGFKAIGTGIDHGTVTVVVNDQPYEITTLRVDEETDGRHAEVAYTSDWREDAARRDFTMNALYVDGGGTIHDPLNGYDDVVARRVRFIGNPADRITEDYLRILRFFRFSAQYGKGDVDKKGLAACVRLQKGLNGLSAERIGAELLKMLPMPGIVSVLDVMFSHGLLLPLIFRVPHLSRFNSWLQLEQALGHPVSAIHRLAALGVLVNEDAVSLAKSLRLSNAQHRALGFWGAGHRVDENCSEKQARLLSYDLGEDYQTRIAIDWVLSGADPASKTWRHLHDLPERWQNPVFPIKGQDLLDSGIPAGPALGRKLSKLEEIWIDSDFTAERGDLLKHHITNA